MSLTRQGGTGQTRPGGSVAKCGKTGNNRPKSRDRDTLPTADLRGLAAAPAPVPTREAQATGKWRDNIRRGGSRARQSEQPKTGGISPAASRHHERPDAASRDRSCGRTPGDGRDCCTAGNRAARNRRVPAPIPSSVLSSLIHPRTTVAIGRGSGQRSRTGFDSDSMFLENSPIWGQGIIARRT